MGNIISLLIYGSLNLLLRNQRTCQSRAHKIAASVNSVCLHCLENIICDEFPFQVIY